MDRYDVIATLERRPIGASRACADALRAAAQVVFEKEFATSDLLTMYRNRASREQAGETPTRGLAEAVHDLADSDHDRLHLIGIEATGARYQFLLFVTPAGPNVVACLGRHRNTKREPSSCIDHREGPERPTGGGVTQVTQAGG